MTGISLIEAASLTSNTTLPGHAKKDRQYCTHIQDYDEDGTPVIGKSCSDDMKTCKKDPEN